LLSQAVAVRLKRNSTSIGVALTSGIEGFGVGVVVAPWLAGMPKPKKLPATSAVTIRIRFFIVRIVAFESEMEVKVFREINVSENHLKDSAPSQGDPGQYSLCTG
jgi:hypothetical protein